MTEDADIVIGADGVNSKLREFLLGADKPRFSGYIAHRAIFPAALLNGLPIRSCTKWWGPRSHILVYYMTQAREEVYVVSSVPAPGWDVPESYLPCDRESFVAAFEGFHPELRHVVAAAPSVTQWPIFDREPVDCWSRGALVLLGDACHPMRPYMASGAAMAIEDGAILARCIAEIGTAILLSRSDGMKPTACRAPTRCSESRKPIPGCAVRPIPTGSTLTMLAKYLCSPLKKRRANWRNKGNSHGRIHLHHLRDPICSDRRSACRLPDLR